MKPIKCFFLLLSFSLVIGCATTFRPWKLSEIEEGMTRSQVVNILGEPDSVSTQDGADLLHYSYREGYNPPMSSGDYNSPMAGRHEDRQLQRSMKEHKYVVKLVDGKVQHYREVRD